MKVLVVDDSLVARKMVTKHLKNTPEYQDIEVIEAKTGESGLELFNQEINLVVSDWNMPGISGLELVQQIRALEEKEWERSKEESVPIIMITTEATMNRVISAIDSGVNEYIIKPFPAELLIEAMDRIFKQDTEEQAVEA